MSLVKRFIGPLFPNKAADEHPFRGFFLASQHEPDFPYTLAKHTFENLEASTNKKEEFFHYLLEDIIFSSLYATFYEQLLLTIRQNPSVGLALIDRFEQETAERERMIAEQTEYHVNFVLNKGLCPGCSGCDNHSDVAELINYWQRGDIDFFINLYMGMQTIQYAMEQLIYDILPLHTELFDELTAQNILSYRQFVFDYAEKRKN